MNKDKKGLFSKLLKWMLPVLVIVVGLFISSVIRNSRPEVGVVTPVKKVTLIRGVIAKKTSFQPVIHAQGTVQAKRQIELVPEVAGKIIWVSPDFAQGGLFSKGEKLILIDPRNYEFAVARAQASVADARNKLVLEEAEAELAKTEWEDLGGGEASPLVLREPQMATARAKLASAKADLDRALLDLERTVIKAPFDGRVEEKKVDIGQYVSLGSQLAVLYSTDVAEISLPLTDRELGKLDLQLIYGEQNKNKKTLEKPLAVRLYAPVGGKRRNWTGNIVRTAGTIDLNSRILSVIVEVKNPYKVHKGGAPLLNGLFVEAEIPGREMHDVYILPKSALYKQNRVVIVDQDDRLRSLEVEIIHSTSQHVVVRGLKDGQRVNTVPLDVLIEGTKVKWQLVEEDSP
ncbi:MAG TPA: efflux RND transporter periplasmic adaptor subunit [Sphingomonadales bacterium]|nr:efflux RND transporter periplasmic adaptor subunit [Sphingomonadales bacterium]